MPRQKRNTNQTQELSIRKKFSSNSTMMDISSKIMDNNHLNLEMWKAEIKDRMKDALVKLNDMEKENLAMFELGFRNSLMAIPNTVLSTEMDINCEDFRSAFLGFDVENKSKDRSTAFSSPAALTTIRRRSRSAGVVKFDGSNKRTHRLRSTSVDIYKTPKTTVRLSSIMSNKKYTVTKPPVKEENSGVHVKRIMRPDEEAISTCGSPLYVASCNLGAPHANIPLPGGVVLNIQPKAPRGPMKVPQLDAKTKTQIKMLCEQLNKLF